MLGDEYWVAAERRLLAIVWNDRRSEAPGNEILSVGQHHRQPLATQIIEILTAQMEAAAEGRFSERGKEIVEVSHMVGGVRPFCITYPAAKFYMGRAFNLQYVFKGAIE